MAYDSKTTAQRILSGAELEQRPDDSVALIVDSRHNYSFISSMLGGNGIKESTREEVRDDGKFALTYDGQNSDLVTRMHSEAREKFPKSDSPELQP